MKIRFGKEVIVAQSVKEKLVGGGYQDPLIRFDGERLYLKFNVRDDNSATFGQEGGNPLFVSGDGGATWKLDECEDDWIRALKPMSNGDRLQFSEYPTLFDLPELPKAAADRKNIATCAGHRTIYTVDELTPYLGDRIKKVFSAKRIKAGGDTPVDEVCEVRWKNMDVSYFEDYEPKFLRRYFGMQFYEHEGRLYMPLSGGFIKDDGSVGSRRACIHLLVSDDFGRSWDYLNTAVYKEEFNEPTAIDVEGFLEAALCFSGGRMAIILRSGSLSPFIIGDENHKAPKMMICFSDDGGKTISEPKEFYDFGVFPRVISVGKRFLTCSGRPGVYIRICEDVRLESWSEPEFILKVPDDEIYDGYFKYSCSNSDVAATGENEAVIAYSDFTKFVGGQRAKSIIVRKIYLE